MATIKAGTYVFKQTITNPTSNISAVTFKNVKGYYLTANNTYVSAPEDITDWSLTPNGCSFSVGQKPNNMNNWTTSFYDFSSGGLVTYTADDKTLLRTIIVTAGQTNVSEAFYNWFIANIETTPTYKFKHWKKSNVVVNRTLVGQKYYYFKPYTILGLYTITTTLTNCTGASANATKIQENGDLTLTFTANSGYELPTSVSVTNVTSYNWNKATGVLAISKPTGDVAIEIVAVSALPQLSTPTNVAVTDTTLTFDEVANATSYEVFVDNVSIGTHTIQTTETWLLNETLSGTLAKTPIKFYSNNTWYSISVEPFVSGTTLLYYYESVEGEEDTYDEVYSNGTWQNKAYRTITFEKSPTGELLTWLQANGVKQASPLIIKKGTYIWNDTFVQTADVDLDNNLNFKSNNIDFFELFISFYIDDSNKTIDYNNGEELINAYSNGTWSNVAYKTIIVTADTFVDSDFYTFFNANTTKQ